ncbi:hypothetical protein NLU14_07970 [Marinobacter sp. 71-i]|uniref:Lipoprotein n=1 Tax=Marinobacter iranensis TaxID=2962607 RepID=A0ABT5Y919_9GAMM|nr:hypothetical protein [Marinobacter iranensis]MDF0750167.1 hypothetical protein [Marinobacter iranensis]
MRNVFFAAISIALLAGCSEKTEKVNACIERGVEYFKEIGSYPTLSSAPNKGRNAEEVALERCNRTTTAF